MTAINQDGLYAALIAALIRPLLGPDFQVIRTNDNAPKPADPYVALNLGPFTQIGWDEPGEPDSASGDVIVYGMRETLLTLEVYGGGALQTCENLRDSLNTGGVRAALRARGVSIGTRSPMLNLTKLYETQWKERGQFQARLRFRSEALDPNVGRIEDVRARINAHGAGGIVSVDVNIDSTP